MKKDNKHMIHLSAEQIQQYVTGRALPSEARVVEKHMLECSFCEEAVEGAEGYFGKSGFAVDVDILKHRLQQEVEEKRRFVLPMRQIGIAATVIILLGVGSFFIWQFTSEIPEKEHIVQKTPTQKTKEKNRRQYKKELKDSNALAKEEELILPEQKELITSSDEQNEEVEKNQEPIPMPIVEENAISDVADVSESIEADEIQNETEPEVKEELQSEMANEGIESIEIKDVSKAKKAKTLAAESSIRGARSGASQTFIDGVKVRESTVSADSQDYGVRPEGGMKKFESYIKRELRYSQTAKENNVKGKVKVSFKVDKNGKLSSFKILKGLGYGCDDEAIRLIKSGPAWLPATQNGQAVDKTKVLSIKFK